MIIIKCEHFPNFIVVEKTVAGSIRRRHIALRQANSNEWKNQLFLSSQNRNTFTIKQKIDLLQKQRIYRTVYRIAQSQSIRHHGGR